MTHFKGFIVHAYVDLKRNRLFLPGRLEDGRSFAIVETRWRPCLHISEGDKERVIAVLRDTSYSIAPSSLQSFSGVETLFRLDFPGYAARSAAVRLLEDAGITGPDTDAKPADLFLIEKCIKGPVEILGEAKPGRRVDLVFTNPELRGYTGNKNLTTENTENTERRAGEWPLRIASIDIETDTHNGTILAVAIAVSSGSNLNNPPEGLVRVLSKNFTTEYTENTEKAEKIIKTPCSSVVEYSSVPIFHEDEASLLQAFIDDISRTDPDVLTGWNFLDFDFPRLAERCRHYHIPFALGRAGEGAKFFPGEGRRSAAAHVPGRQVIDALRIVRSGPSSYINVGTGGSFTLENVARTVLGEGKLVSSSGEDKLAELERLYREDPVAFGEYCFQDACLVPRILAKTGLWRLTLERATLTGVTLDKAWTSVVSFERIYAMELGRRGIAPPAAKSIEVSGAAGGTVLESFQGLFSNIAVFDFRSLYPTIIRTFNIDPLSHAKALSENSVIAPNGAAFSRKPGPLPALIAEYFAARKHALDSGDATAAQVYKILMNSFYGVLGSSTCRYGRTELAGAITSFARKWLLFSRDWFSEKGMRVLYGDTDSLFVETGLGDEAGYEEFQTFCNGMAQEINTRLSKKIRKEYGLESHIELRFEKAYRRFLIPPLRSSHDESASRGRAKGYGGAILESDGKLTVEVKGMEAVRSDSTPLARRLQMELLELVFSDSPEDVFAEKVRDTLKQLRQGKLDGELVYRKRLSRPPETYTASTPPQVKAARALGWHHRRGTVEFVWTIAGPAPVSLPHEALDYDHYTDSQVLPLARSIAAAAGWNTELFPEKGKNRRDYEDGQMNLLF